MKAATKVTRGQAIKTSGGAIGIYVGTRDGIEWVCYEQDTYQAMCDAFDRQTQ